MLSLGEKGIQRICDQIVPAGTGDDTQPRFAVEVSVPLSFAEGKREQKKLFGKKYALKMQRTRKIMVSKIFYETTPDNRGRSISCALKIF